MYDVLVNKLRSCGKGQCSPYCSDKDIGGWADDCRDALVLEAADAIEELAAKYNKAITDIVKHEKPREWKKRMEVKDAPGVTVYNPVWSCPCCGLDYDPAVAKRINYCYRCGVKIGGVERKEGDND